MPDTGEYRKHFGLPGRETTKDALARIAEVNRPAMQRFIETIRLKGYSPNTERTYRNEFAQLLDKLGSAPVDRLAPEGLRRYMLYCTQDLKLSEATLHSRLNAIKFYVEQVLHREKFFAEIPRPKKPRTLPKHISPQDVKRLFDHTPNLKGGSKYLERMAREAIVRSDKAQRREDTGMKYPTELQRSMSERGRAFNRTFDDRSCRRSEVLRVTLKHNTMLRLCYGLGLRVSELVGLKVTDIDSGNMQVHIRRAKGKKDRYVALPTSILEQLRAYFREYRPKEYLFEGQYGGAYTARSAQAVFKQALRKAGINKPIGIHGLRHSYATHLLEAGTDIGFIQKLLGHEDIKTTLLYAQVTNHDLKRIKSPLDNL